MAAVAATAGAAVADAAVTAVNRPFGQMILTPAPERTRFAPAFFIPLCENNPEEATMRIIFAVAVILFPAMGDAQEPVADAVAPAPDAAKHRQAKLAFFRDRIRDLDLRGTGDDQQPFALVERPLLQFDNPVSGIADGFVFIWTDGGRPAALMKSYFNSPRESWGRTYVSLSPKLIVMRERGQPHWKPSEPGVAFRQMKNAQAPADSARGRLTQMRDLAARFRVVDNWGLTDPTDWQLRLLRAPLYRYQAPGEGVVDGALFGYVLTSSPEAVVLVEARKTNSALEWHYAAMRSTRFAITVWLDDEKVAEFSRLNAWPADGVYYHHPLPLTDYPFRREK